MCMEKSTKFRLITQGNSDLATGGFWSRAAPEKALLTFRAMKMPCSHSAFPYSWYPAVAAGLYRENLPSLVCLAGSATVKR